MGLFDFFKKIGKSIVRGVSWVGKKIRTGVNWGKKAIGKASLFIRRHGGAIDSASRFLGFGGVTGKIAGALETASGVLGNVGTAVNVGEAAGRALGLDKFAGVQT